MSYVGWPWWSSWDLLRLDAWNKWPKHILPNAGEFNGDESLHGIESIKLGQSSLNSLIRFWTMLDLTSSPLAIPPGKDWWCTPLPLVLVDIRAPKTKIATFWGVAIAILLSLWCKPRKNGGFWPSQKSSVKTPDRSPSSWPSASGSGIPRRKFFRGSDVW